jgi:hypothetical protein
MPRSSFSLIRYLSAPFDGPRVAAAEFECTVYILDLKARKRVSAFESAFDAGGSRIAMNPRGDMCAVASYRLGGLACYDADSGEVICIRDDLVKLLGIVYSPEGQRLYCGAERGPLRVFDAETGADLERSPATERVFCSPYRPIEILRKRKHGPLEIRAIGGKRIATAARETFALLDVAFGLDRLCLSESGGPVRCLATESGAELWRYVPRPGRHVLKLAHASKARAFLGVEWPYQNGGAKRLLRFDAESGQPTLVAKMEKPTAGEVFCSRGEAVLTTAGELIDTATGVTKNAFRFPTS